MEVLQAPHPILLSTAAPLALPLSGQDRAKLVEMLDSMLEAGGIGLAAPQVGWGVQVFVMNTGATRAGEIVLINPMVTYASSEMAEMVEGCLSIPGVSVNVRRPERVNVRAAVIRGSALRRFEDLQPRQMELALRDLDARCAQHEIDHLSGILFTSRGEIIPS